MMVSDMRVSAARIPVVFNRGGGADLMGAMSIPGTHREAIGRQASYMSSDAEHSSGSASGPNLNTEPTNPRKSGFNTQITSASALDMGQNPFGRVIATFLPLVAEFLPRYCRTTILGYSIH
jgi:hypothetical protein